MSNWFQKLGFGLKKTSTRLTSGITDIFIKRKVDSQTLEELEDLLITSDLGVKAAQKSSLLLPPAVLIKTPTSKKSKPNWPTTSRRFLTHANNPFSSRMKNLMLF